MASEGHGARVQNTTELADRHGYVFGYGGYQIHVTLTGTQGFEPR